MKHFFRFAGFAFPVVVFSASIAVNAALVVSPSEWQIGEVSEGAKVAQEFEIKNTGLVPVRITELVRTCTCGNPEIDRREIKPNEKAVYRLQLDPGVLPAGPFVKTFYLRTDDSAQQVIGIMARGTVKPEWKLSPGKSIHLKNGGLAKFFIGGFEAPPVFSECRVFDSAGDDPGIPATMAPGENGETMVVFDAPRGNGDGFREWTIVLKTPENRELKLNVSKGRGETWWCSPGKLLLPEGEGEAELPFKLVVDSLLSSRYSAMRPDRIQLENAPDGVALEPDGTVTWKSLPMKIRFSAAARSRWRSGALRIRLPSGEKTTLFVEKDAKGGE